MATIYAYSSNNIHCTYTLSAARSGSTVTITASGTIYGNGSSQDATSGQKLYAQLRYGVSPSQTQSNPEKGGTGTTTYVSNYGTLLENNGWSWTSSTVVGGYNSSTNGSRKIADNDSSSFPSLNAAGFPTGGRSFTITWTATNNNALSLSDVALFFFRDSTSTSVSSTDKYKVYTFVGKKDSSLSGNYSRYYTQSLSVGVGYSATSAPTSISIKDSISIQKPGEKIIVQWSGATAGTSNSINGYQVYGGTSSNPTTLLATISSTSTSSSYEYTIPSTATRGNTYYFRVRTTGSAGSSYYSGYSSQVSCKVNTLPTAPTITLSGVTILNNVNYIKSNGTATFSFSSNDADGHAITYYRNTTNSISGATAITGTSWSTSTGGTYYFWAKDSLGEYSSVSSKSFTKNVKPSANGTNLTLTRTNQYTSNQITNWLKDYYYTAGKATITGVTSTCGVASYTWNIRTYNYSGGDTTPTFVTVVKDYTSTTTTTNSCNYSYPINGDWGKAYKIRCIITDKLGEQSSEIISDGYCVIPPTPSFNTNIYNQLGTNVSTMPTTNVAGSVTNNFYQTVVTSLTKDTSISLTFSLTPTATVGWYSGASNTTYRSSGVIPLTISGASRDTSYTLRITATAAWGNSFYKDYTIKRAGEPKVQIGSTIRNFSSDDITLHGTEVKPFTSTANLNFSFKLGLTGYNFTESALENADAFLFANSTKTRIKEKQNRQTTDGERYIYTQQGGENPDSGLYNWNTNTLNLNINSATNPVSFRIEFTNVFGETFYYTKSGLNFNFVETPTVSVTIGSSAGSTEGTILKENDTITYTPNITFYNTDKAVTIRTYIYRSTSTSSQIGGSWELYNGTNSNNGITYTPSRGTSTNSAIIYNTPITYTVGEIIESKYLYFKINITYGSNTINSNIPGTYYISQRHKKVDNLSVNVSYENDLFSYTTLLADRGGGLITTSADDTATGLTKVNYGLQFSQTNDFSTFLWLNSEGALVEPSENPDWRTTWVPSQEQRIPPSSYTDSNIDLGSNWDFYNIRPVYYTKIGDIEKTTYGLISTIYGISPTISYRKNQIGVNISNIENRYPEAIIAVGGATDKKYIEFHTVTANASIDLTTGALDGFILVGDAGSWD